MTSRRDFLRSSLILGGGLLVGDAALEAFERLTHTRKSFPSAWGPQPTLITDAELHALLKRVYADFRVRLHTDYVNVLRGPYARQLSATAAPNVLFVNPGTVSPLVIA